MTKFAQTWRVLHEAFRQSLHPQNWVLALGGTLAMVGVWILAGMLLLRGGGQLSAAQGTAEYRIHEQHQLLSSLTERLPSANLLKKLAQGNSSEVGTGRLHSLATDAPKTPIAAYLRLADPVRRLFVAGHTWSTFGYYLLGGLGSILTWSYVGLAITRRTILQIGREETLGFRDAIRFGGQKGYTVFSAVTIPLIAIAMMAIPVVVLGVLMKWNVGVFVAGLLWIAVSLVSCFMAVLAIGLFLSWPLMWGAVCADEVDGFDAISRSYAYGMQRPVNYLSYLLLALVMGMLGWAAAWVISEMVIALNYWCVELGSGATRLNQVLQQIELPRQIQPSENGANDNSKLLQNAGFLIRGVESLVRGLASSFSYSWFFSMAGAIYLLLRRDVDDTELDQIFETSRSDS